MNVEVNNIYFDEIIGRLKIEGIFEDFNVNQVIYKFGIIEKREGIDNKLYKKIKKYIKLEVDKNNKFSVVIDIFKEKEFFCCSLYWDLYIYDESNKTHYRCNASDLNYIAGSFFVIDEYAREVRPYKTLDGKVSILSRKLFDNIECFNVDDDNGILSLDWGNIRRFKENMIIRLKRRVNINIISYDYVIEAPIINFNVAINEYLFKNITIKPDSVFDVFIVLCPHEEYEQEYPVSIYDKNGIEKTYNNTLNMRYYTTKANTLAYIFEDSNNILIDEIYIDDKENLIMKGEIPFKENDFEIRELCSVNTYTKYYLYEPNSIKLSKIEFLEKKHIKISIELEYFRKHFRNTVENIFTIYLRLKFKNFVQEEYLSLKLANNLNKINVDVDALNIEFISREKRLSLSIKNIHGITNSPIKIGILGSCYSRLPFSSEKYFNPNYKSKYKVVFTQFHSSLISIMNERKRFFDERYFEVLKPQFKEYVKADFQKEFFEKFKESEVEFLIIDLYVDGEKGIIRFEDGTIVTGGWDVERSEYLYTLTDKDETIHSKDVDAYLILWKEAAERFAKEIVKYIQEDRIIINFINMTEEYKTKNQIGRFEKQLDFIHRSNSLLNYMSEYLKNLLPKAKYIDTRNLGYIGFENHPIGNTPNHYESEYYKEFLKLFDDLMVRTFINTNK